MKTDIFTVPVWALCYLINDDPTNLEDGEKEIIDEWRSKNHILDVFCPDDVDSDSYFSYYPPFGKGCDVVECVCAIK